MDIGKLIREEGKGVSLGRQERDGDNTEEKGKWAK